MDEEFTLSTKSNTLKFLKSPLKFSSIEKIYDFTVEEWKSNYKQIILNIQSKFKEQIIIRSSAIGEDSKTNSFAGAYDSILNIDTKITEQIIQAINSVIDSYHVQGNLNLQNQILVQNQTSNISLNGVLFSRNENNGSPYYTINYEKGSSTTNVTHGKTNNVIKIFRDVDFSILTTEWKLLFKSIEEIEEILDLDYLDIEFAITKSNEVVIFQVRPITTINSEYDIPQIQLIKNEIDLCKTLFLKSGNDQIEKSPFATLVKENAKWIASRQNPKSLTLNYLNYKKSQSDDRNYLTKFDEIKNYKNELKFEFISNDEESIEKSKEISERRERWGRILQSDFQLNEGLKVLDNLKSRVINKKSIIANKD